VLTVVIGVGDRVMSEMMREPVTVTDSVFCAVCWAWAALVSATTLAAHISASLFTLVVIIFPPGNFCMVGREAIRQWQRCQQKTETATIFSPPRAAGMAHLPNRLFLHAI